MGTFSSSFLSSGSQHWTCFLPLSNHWATPAVFSGTRAQIFFERGNTSHPSLQRNEDFWLLIWEIEPGTRELPIHSHNPSFEENNCELLRGSSFILKTLWTLQKCQWFSLRHELWDKLQPTKPMSPHSFSLDVGLWTLSFISLQCYTFDLQTRRPSTYKMFNGEPSSS